MTVLKARQISRITIFLSTHQFPPIRPLSTTYGDFLPAHTRIDPLKITKITMPFHPQNEHFDRSLSIFWLKDESLEDTENLPAPDLLAQEIVENLESALLQFESILEALGDDG